MGTTVTIVNNTRALLETDHELVRDVVDDALSITIPNAWRSPQYRSGLWDGKKHLLTPSGSFPLGLLPAVEEALAAQKTAYDVKDDRDEMLRFRVHTVPDQLLQASPADAKRGAWQDASGTWWLKLELHQKQAIAAALNEGSGIIFSATGTGKCLGKGTPVMRADGSVVPVEEVKKGDLLMGPDSKPRRVLSTTKGVGPLYCITPVKGDPWVCNDVHVLTLKHTETGEIIDIPLNEYLQKHNYFKHCHKQFSVGVDFPSAGALVLDPYFLGVWYGDGSKDLQMIRVSKPDPEIKQLMQDMADAHGLELKIDNYTSCPDYRLSAPKGQPNHLLRLMRAVVGTCETIPHAYLTASRADRQALLAGFLDTDGYLSGSGYEIMQVRKGLAEGVCFLARSLGLRATMKEKVVNGASYWRVHISGDCTGLPLRIPRKKPLPRLINKDATRTGFSADPIGEGDFYGFTLDGDGRFLLGDFTVTHNTEVACGIAALSKRLTKDKVSILFFTHRRKLARDTRKRFAVRLGVPLEDIGLIAHGKWEEGRSGVYVALLDTLKQPKYAKQRKQLFKDVDILIIDECHHASATTWYQLIQKCDAPLRLGLSGTPLHRSDQKDAMLIGATGRVIFQMDMKQAQAAGVITPVEITTVPVRDTTVPMSFKDEWRDIYVKGVVDNFAFHETVAENVEKDVASKRTTLVLVQEIKHAENLLAVFDDWGIRAELVHGQLHETEQDDVVSKFGKGVFPVLIATTFLGEGVDIPAVDSVHLCNSEKAVIPVIQKIGRGVRKGVTGKVCRVTDYLHMTHKTLANHSLERLKIYKEWGLLGEE